MPRAESKQSLGIDDIPGLPGTRHVDEMLFSLEGITGQGDAGLLIGPPTEPPAIRPYLRIKPIRPPDAATGEDGLELAHHWRRSRSTHLLWLEEWCGQHAHVSQGDSVPAGQGEWAPLTQEAVLSNCTVFTCQRLAMSRLCSSTKMATAHVGSLWARGEARRIGYPITLFHAQETVCAGLCCLPSLSA